MSYPKIKEVTTRLWGKQDVHFTVNEDVNIIVGVNGSGKTTLLNAISQANSHSFRKILIFTVKRHSFALAAMICARSVPRSDYRCRVSSVEQGITLLTVPTTAIC